MPKLKRTSDVQINKDMYEQQEDDDPRFTEAPDPGQGMTRASDDVMKRRKIVKIRRNLGGGSGATAAAPSAPSMPPSSKPSNPFASTTLASSNKPTASTTDNDEPSSKPNPFANFSFASNNNAAASSKPTFSFGAPAPAPASSASFSLPSASSSTTPSTSLMPSPSSTSQTLSKKSKSEKIKQLNRNFLQMIVNHWDYGLHSQEYSDFFLEYKKFADTLLEDESEASSGSAAPTASAISSASAPVTASATTPSSAASSSQNTTKSNTSWSFGASPAPAPAKPFASFSFGSTAPAPAAPPAGTFSFGSNSTTAAPVSSQMSAKPSFSFGSIPPPPPSIISSANDDDDPTSNPDDGKLEKVEQEENTEEEVLLEVRAKHLKCIDGKWKKFGAGVLRLYRHKTTSKHRMVLRNEIGKVQLNLAVGKGMPFEKVLKKSSKGTAAYVSFAAVEDEAKGMESFMLQVKPEMLDKIHATLQGMTA